MRQGRRISKCCGRALAIVTVVCTFGTVAAQPVATTTSTSSSSSTSRSTTSSTSTSTTTLPPLCGETPRSGCRGGLAFRSSLQLNHDPSDETKDQLKWKWNRGALTFVSDFADPVNGSATY